MKQFLFSMLALLSICLNSFGQAFTPSKEYHEETVVYATVVTSDGSSYMLDGSTLYAFIGDECRGAVSMSMSQTVPPFAYYQIRVGGSTDDLKKDITFKLYTPQGYIYDVACATQRIVYLGDETYNEPNNLVTLQLDGTPMTSVKLDYSIYANVGESVPYENFIIPQPYGCAVPENFYDMFEVNIGNHTQFAELVTENGKKCVKALKQTSKMENLPAIEVKQDGQQLGNVSLYFRLPMTGVQLKQGLTNTYTIPLDKEEGYETAITQQLTEFLHGCYDILPVGADAEELFWKAVEGQTVVDVCSLRIFKPVAVGETTLSLVQDLYDAESPVFLTMTIKVVEPVTDIVINKGTPILATVGDDLSAIVNADYTVLPAEAEDKSVTISSNNLSVVDADLKAVAAGRTTIKIQSNSDPTKTAEIGVVVSEKPDVTVNNQTLSYMAGNLPTSAAFTADVTGNITVTPAGSSYTVTSSNEEVMTVTLTQGNSYALTGKIGESEVTVSVPYTVTVLKQDPTGTVLDDETRYVDATFKVIVAAQLEGFTINNAYFALGNKSVGTDLIITPIPAGYPIDMSKLEVKVNSSLYGNYPWEIAELSFTSASENGIVYNLTPKSVGSGNILVTYNGEYPDIYFEGSLCDPQVNIGASLTMEQGWSWISIPAGMSSIEEAFGAATEGNIEEVRSQYELLYNDPKFGYFGDLGSIDKGSCYKVKSNVLFETVIAYNSDAAYYPFENPTIYLGPKWNWIGNPYQYQQSISAAFGRTGYDEGDMIISKNGQFTTYNNGVWNGTLTSFVPGQGYLFYNNGEKSEINLIAEAKLGSGITTAKATAAESSVWSYDHSKFSDNMPVIATISNIDNSAHYTVGAFVGNECRGEGKCINGKYYIGIHGKAGEKVNFKLYNEYTGEYTDVESTITMSKMAGSYDAPVVLEADMATTGIATAVSAIASADAQLFNAAGQRVGANQKGMVISKNGKFVK